MPPVEPRKPVESSKPGSKKSAAINNVLEANFPGEAYAGARKTALAELMQVNLVAFKSTTKSEETFDAQRNAFESQKNRDILNILERHFSKVDEADRIEAAVQLSAIDLSADRSPAS